jgi:hypothetical protein
MGCTLLAVSERVELTRRRRRKKLVSAEEG